MEPISRESLDSIREVLRERGYLERGLDRFLLRGAGSTSGWLTGSLRAGLLSGCFLGLLLLAVLLFSNEPALTSPREILLLGLYLTCLGTLVTIGFELASSVLARVLSRVFPEAARDSGRIAAWMGGAGTLAAGLYLSFWWRARGAGLWGFGAQIAVLFLILTVSLVFGRVTSLTALVSLLRPGRLPQRRSTSRWQRGALAALLILVTSIVVIPWGRSREISGTRAGDFRISPPAGRILWVGIDGLGSELFKALRSGGHLKFLSRLAEVGCRVDLDRPSAEPPAVWVSAATGFLPSRHGVVGVEASTLAGIPTPVGPSSWTTPLVRAARWMAPSLRPVREVPVSGAFRRDKMVWEILAERGIPSFVANWWATWPVEEGPGIRISERAFFRLESGGAPDREIFPAEEFGRLRASFPEFLALHRRASREERPGRAEDLAVLLDAFHLERAREGWRQGRWPLVAVYLNGSDLLSGRPEPEEASSAEQFRRTKQLVEHLDQVDSELELLAGELAPEDRLVILTDPGRRRHPRDDRALLLMRGSGILGGRSGRGGLLDIAPILLRLMGFPRSREMVGRVPPFCIDPAGDLAEPEPSPVPTYGMRQPPDSRASDFDPEVLDKLRSLGYIR